MSSYENHPISNTELSDMPRSRRGNQLPPLKMTPQHPSAQSTGPLNSGHQPSAHSTPAIDSGVYSAPPSVATIVHVPSSGDSSNKASIQRAVRAAPGIISIPGSESGAGVPLEASLSSTIDYEAKTPNFKALDMVVYFMDKSGVSLSVEDGQNAEAGELFEMLMDEKHLPAAARDVFSLWLVSDLLELQLKPHHIPFKLICYWEELLEKYTSASEYDIQRDEPVIMFQRNVFYTRFKEKTLMNAEILRLLFHEAKENVVDGRYPVSEEQCDRLAGLQSLIRHRTFDDSIHTESYYKNVIEEFYPKHLCKKKWFSSKESPHKRLVTNHKAAFHDHGDLIENSHSMTQCYRHYLALCQKLPYYGAAFFRGQIEHPSDSKIKLRSVQDDPIYVAINTEGIFIIDLDDVEFLLGLLYSELSWEYAEPQDRENRNCLPCLFIQFVSTDEGRTCSKLLQVFSREAMMMDALIEANIQLKKKSKPAIGEDDIDGDGRPDEGVMKSGGEVWKKFDRLSLSTFNCQGKLIKKK